MSDIMELVENIILNYKSNLPIIKSLQKLKTRIQAMQEVVDAAVRFEEKSVIKATPGHCVECDLIIVVKKYKEAIKK